MHHETRLAVADADQHKKIHTYHRPKIVQWFWIAIKASFLSFKTILNVINTPCLSILTVDLSIHQVVDLSIHQVSNHNGAKVRFPSTKRRRYSHETSSWLYRYSRAVIRPSKRSKISINKILEPIVGKFVIIAIRYFKFIYLVRFYWTIP